MTLEVMHMLCLVFTTQVVSSAGGLVSRSNLETTLRTAFASERSPAAEGQKAYVRKYITDFFTDLDGGSSEHLSRQHFQVIDNGTLLNGTNLIWMLPGERYGTPQDALFFISAHYDSVKGTPGVDDNGSGMAVMLEIARALATESTCIRRNSLLFVAYDFEEWYNNNICHGSRHFVEEYFVPEILRKFNIAAKTVRGGVVFDTIMNYDERPDTQHLPDGMDQFFPNQSQELIANDKKSDRILMVGRQNEINMARDFMATWDKSFTKGPLGFMLPITGRPAENTNADYFGDLYRSDHFNFWNTNSMNISNIPVMFFTDSGDFRGYMQQCYHSSCDDVSHLTEPVLSFIHETAESIAQMSQTYSCDIGVSGCQLPQGSPLLWILGLIVAMVSRVIE